MLTDRDFGSLHDPAGTYPSYVNRWAIVVGISKYQHSQMNLRYAHRDAEELVGLLQTPAGGGYERKRMEVLIDADATTRNITRALRSFLKKPAAEDLVLIYLACHGAPDPDRPQVVYLLTHDTDPSDVAGSALPMREVDDALTDNLLAERVVILADTCHSGAIGGGIGRRTLDDSGVVNRYLQDLSEARRGIALLTSAQSGESSLEDLRWGDGHGVFTHYILEGLRGSADRNPRNGTVTVGELFDYVRENVIASTDNRQHPVTGSNRFDRALPMAVTGGATAQDHLLAAQGMRWLGDRMHDAGCIRSAAMVVADAIRLAKAAGVEFPEAHAELGRYWLALGDVGRAIEALSDGLALDKARNVAELRLLTAIALARKPDFGRAAALLDDYLALAADDADGDWWRWVADKLREGTPRTRRTALVVGVGTFAENAFPSLPGVGMDLETMARCLSDDCDFDSVTVLRDEDATKAAILAAIGDSRDDTADMRLVYLAGLVLDGHFIPHDGKHGEVGITGAEIHDAMLRNSALESVLVTDSDPIPELLAAATQAGRYQLIMSASPGQHAYEEQASIADQVDTASGGVFTRAFARLLPDATVTGASWSALVQQTAEAMKAADVNRNQTPVFAGRRDVPVLARSDWPWFDAVTGFGLDASTPDRLAHLYRVAQSRMSIHFPSLWRSLALAFLDHRDAESLLQCATRALADAGEGAAADSMLLATAQASAGSYRVAADTIQTALDRDSDEDDPVNARPLLAKINDLERGRGEALIVGIDRYIASDIASLRGAANDARAMGRLLREELGFDRSRVTILLDEDATRSRIIDEFRRLTGSAREEPAVFHFSGYGSDDQGGLTIVAADSRSDGIPDIGLGELSELTGKGAAHLLSILDAGWTRMGDSESSRNLARAQATVQRTSGPGLRDLSGPPRTLELVDAAQIGAVTATNRSIRSTVSYPGYSMENQEWPGRSPYRGIFSRLVEKFLRNVEQDALTVGALEATLTEANGGIVLAQDRNALLLPGPSSADNISELAVVYHTPRIRGTIDAIQRLNERHGGSHPDGHLMLGIAHAVMRDWESAVEYLETAITQTKGGHLPRAHYYLGRVLLDSRKDIERAVSELRIACEQDPDHAAAWLYFAEALRSLVEGETLVEARGALQRYFDLGAPLGSPAAIVQFLEQRERIAGRGEQAGLTSPARFSR